MGGAELALLRFSGEVGIKAPATRRQFERRLIHNLRDAIASQGGVPRIRVSRDRVFVELGSRGEAEALTRVFGVQSVSMVEQRSETQLHEIVRAGEALFRERVRGRRFAVRARRVGNRDRIPVTAGEVKRALGAALLPVSAGVDLDDPEVTVHAEILEDETCFFPDRIPGPGGVPLGVEGAAVALVSGGFDSAVAAWQILRRGVRLDYVFCNLGGATHLQGVLRVVKVLADRWSYGDHPRLHVVDFEGLTAALRDRTETRFWQVLLKRLMLRAAERVARERRATAVVTGEAVAQVSSQTLQNLAVISQAASGLILRPLAGANKEEIIDLARRIGTYELSRVVGEYCAIVPSRPATGASLRAILAEEEKLDPALVERAVAAREVFDLRGFDVEKLGLPELETDRVPEGATVVDLRSKPEFASWHYPGAVRLDFPEALRAFPDFDRSRPYLLYCEFGLKSAHLAELMRREGFEAFHIRGGTRALRRLVDRSARAGGGGGTSGSTS
jgi:thiamine biosynthesis protein ThiI